MKTEVVIIPNPNQIILLRELQKEFCAIPEYPLCLKCSELKNTDDKVSKAEPKDIYIEENKIFLRVLMEVNGRECEGKIELGTSRQENEIPQKQSFGQNLKKISPFKLAELETEELKNGKKWKLKKEKWIKIK